MIDRKTSLSWRLIRGGMPFVAAIAFTGAAWPAAVGDVAPACAGPTPNGARTIRVADYRGKVVYLDFWASWCPPCRESFPFMNELQREFGNKGLQIIAVSVDKVPGDARRFLERYPPEFTIVLDPTWTCPSAYLLQGMPTTYIIDTSGVIRRVHVGFRESDEPRIRRELLELLGTRK